MPLTIAEIELDRVQVLRTQERQNIVEHRVPGSDQTVFQDLGPLPVSILIEGIMQGPHGLKNLERLRGALTSGETVPFSSDAATPKDVNQVIIQDLTVEELAGTPGAYRYVLRVTEVVEAPSSLTDVDALAEINADIVDEAGVFLENLENGLEAKATLEKLGPKIQRLGVLVKKLAGN